MKKQHQIDREHNFNVDIKVKLIDAGKSKIFDNWKAHSNITREQFIEGVKWLCADTLDEKGRLTRELGLSPNGLIRLKRVYDNYDMVSFYVLSEDTSLCLLWNGELFETDCPQYISPTGKISVTQKISLSAVDRV